MSRQHFSKLLESAKFSTIDKENITIQSEALGRGAHGTVHAALYDGKSCVVKEIHPFLQGMKHKHAPLELVYEEINTLSSLRHPSIVQFLGVYFKQEGSPNNPPIPVLVMERMWKSLFAVLEDYPKQLSLINKAHILHDVSCGLRYLHNKIRPIFHRDLSANNILLNEYLVAKIADLGQARTLGEKHKLLSTAPGNILHMPPEALVANPKYDSTLDIFSLGCITIHTITEKLPIPTDQFVQSQENANAFVKRTEAQRRQQYLDLMDDHSKLQEIAMQCIEDTPTERPNACKVCDKLEEYIEQVEKEFPTLAEQYKQDKLSLIHSNEETKKELTSKHENNIREKVECISLLESQLRNSRSKMEQDKNSFEKERVSLQMKLAEKDEMNKESSKIFQEQVDKLREELKAYDVICIQLQQQIQDLKQQLTHEQSKLLQEKQKIVGQQEEIQLIEDRNQKERLTIQHEKESLQQVNEQLILDNQLLKDKSKTEVANIKEKMNLNIEHQRELFQRKLKEQEIEFSTNQIQMDKLRIDKEQLEEMFCECKQERETFKRRLDEQQADFQVLTDRLRDNAKIELDEANHQIHRLQNELKSKTGELEVFKSNQKITDPGSRLHQKLLEIESAQRDDRSLLLTVIKQQKERITKLQAQLTDLGNKSLTQKHQLEEKSNHLSTLESLLNELSHSKEEKLKSLEEENATFKNLLENNDRIQRNFEKDLKESLKRKEEELQLQKKEHADEIKNLHERYKREIDDLHQDIERYKSQVVGYGEISSLLKKEAEYKSDLEKSMKDRFQKLDTEQRILARSENLKRQIKHKDADIKEKAELIESLEKSHSPSGSSTRYNYSVHWYPYLSLPVKLIRPSIAVTKDKVFVTGGYQSTSPQGRKLDFLENNNGLLCFHLAKCCCDTIASPVVLGALASVSGQCVLVSGADSVGNTLTGNVYVLCEEGSHYEWKEFSKPLPTPRILACAHCYGNRWLIVCGGFAIKPPKEDSALLEAVNVMEILDTTKGEWYPLPEEKCPSFSTILCCAVVREEVYVVGSDQVIKASCNTIIKAATSNSTLAWDNVQIDSDVKLHPFSVVEVNGEPMIIASMTDGEDDVTCVLMKDTGGRWRIMSKAVECQHCSAVVVTSSLELLLFGGSQKISVEEATDTSCKASLIPTLNIHDDEVVSKIEPLIFDTPAAVQGSLPPDTYAPITVNHQPPNLSFTGPIHTIQFDHNGGTFQSPIHKVSLVVPPNALSVGEKVTVYMGAMTSGPFDLPEDCKLRSAVVWLSVSPSDVVFKRSVSVIVPHSAVFTGPQHHSMRFITCEDYKGPRYSFNCSLSQYEIKGEQGVIELKEFAMVAIIASPEFTHDLDDEGVAEGFDSDDDFQDAPEDIESLGISDDMVTPINSHHHQESSSPITIPPACFLAKLFWPRGELPRSFKADIYYIQNLPTELYKVDTLYKKQYYEDNGAYPEIVNTEFVLHADRVKCVLPCYGSSICDCIRGWNVIQMSDTSDMQRNEEHQHGSQSKFSLKFTACDSGAPLTCCFEFQGAERLRKTSSVDLIPPCLQRHFTGKKTPFIMERGIHHCPIAAPIQEPVEKMYDHEIIHGKGHEVIATNAGQGVLTESPPLKNLL